MKTGRPPLKESQKKAQIAGVRLRPEERSLLEKAAALHDQTLSTWMRNILVTSAANELNTETPIKAP